MLECPVSRVHTLLEQAAHEIAEQITTDVLIIEDEPVISMDLEALVTDLGHRVIDVARTRAEAVKAVRRAFSWPRARGYPSCRSKLPGSTQ